MGYKPVKSIAVRASAGTGKTYELALQTIARLADGVPPSAILATTFTRKAAGEILSRVLERLAIATGEQAALDRLNEDLEQVQASLDVPPQTLTQTECLGLLARTCQHIHRLTVSTMDALFARVLRGCLLECGFGEMPDLTDPSSAAATASRVSALDRTLEKLGPTEALEVLNYLFRGRSQRSIAQRLDEAVRDLYDLYRSTSPEAWQHLEAYQPPDPGDVSALVTRLQELADAAKQISLRKGLATLVDSVVNERWNEVLAKGPAAKVAQGVATYNRIALNAETLDALEEAVRIATCALQFDVARRTEGLRRLLDVYVSIYSSQLVDRNLLLFSDVPLELKRVLSLLGAARVRERIDLDPQHLLLDEFQDTNPLQWDVLKLLFGDRRPTVFCAGDTKQAIYGWRGGCAAIFERLQNDVPELAWIYRQRSYRSSQVILDLVDEVFRNLHRVPFLDDYHEVREEWARNYRSHEAARDLAGYAEVRIWRPPADTSEGGNGEGEEAADDGPAGLPYFEWVAAHISRLVQDYPEASIGVLTRTNPAASELAFAVQSLGITASLEGPGALCDDPAVELILSAIHLADHPGSSAQAFHVYHSPLRAVLDMKAREDTEVDEASQRLRERLAAHGYGPVVAEMARVLAPHGNERTAQRLTQLVEAATEYDRVASVRPADFVEHIRRLTVHDSLPARVRIMTIHQSKGLEFDVVVLPELYKRIFPQPPSVLFVKDDEVEPARAVYAYPGETLARCSPELGNALYQHHSRELRDALNVLYVAMTRARHALHLFLRSRPTRKDGSAGSSPPTLQSIVMAALDLSVGQEEVLLVRGRRDWRAEARSAPQRGGEVSRPRVVSPGPVVFHPSRPRRQWPQVAPTEYVQRSVPEAADLFRLNREATVRGAVVHRWFQMVSWLDEGLPASATLISVARPLAADYSDEWYETLLRGFYMMLQRPVTQALLTKPPDALELFREVPFAVRLTDRLVHGRMDRLVILQSDAGSRLTITDFKTDAIREDGVPSRAEHYRPQMHAYAEAASVMFGIPLARITCQLLFVMPDVLVTIPAMYAS